MSTIVSLPYDPTWPALEWAKTHCPSYITNTLSDDTKAGAHTQYTNSYINYYFGNKQDALIFTLKWK
jgi:hypothetical protein